MRACKHGIPPAIILSAILLLGIYSSTDANTPYRDSKQNDQNIFEIENSIIIHGLNMDGTEKDAEEKSFHGKGRIIELEKFGDGFIEIKDTFNKRDAAKKILSDDVIEHYPDENYLKELRKQDIRWHATHYTIKRGDNLWDIAKRFNTETVHIIKINNINKPDLLNPGKIIAVPHRTGIRYRIKKGDTLSEIAAAHGVKAAAIANSNEIKNTGAILYPGMDLFIPDGHRPERRIAGKTKRSDNAGVPDIEKTIKISRFIWPLRGRISSSFGSRIDPFSKKKSFHCGIDISAEPGTPVKAACDGRVIHSGWKEGYGNMVVLRHDDGYITVYAHNRKNLVDKDAMVKQKDIIAYSGMTGAVTGAHLHFEVRKYLTPLNPMRFIRR